MISELIATHSRQIMLHVELMQENRFDQGTDGVSECITRNDCQAMNISTLTP